MSKKIIRKLDDGLVIRHATREDAEALSKFNQALHGEGEWDEKGLAEWTLDLISGESPVFDEGDCTLVEDTRTCEIVSTCCLISQTWDYEGIPFDVGRPELVATKKDYRRRGLVRQQFEILHDWSEKRGELAQAITGIEYYYRQFGYEMTLNLEGGRSGYQVHVPQLKDGEEEAYTFRAADENDIPFLMSTYDLGRKRQMVSAVWDEALWRYELSGKRKYNINKRDIFIIEDQEGVSAGFIGIPPIKWGKSSVLTAYELAPGFSWSTVTPGVIRFLWEKGEIFGKEQQQPQDMFGLWLGETHPAYDVIASNLPRKHKPYAFFMRVPDLPAFIKRITPVLENRLAQSAFANLSGEIKLNFYRDGLSLVFEDGRLEKIKALNFGELESATAGFPPLVFLHLLFGYRTMGELDHAFTDCNVKNEESKHLLNALFPKKPSDVWAIS
jgi:hypothetical protein